jgi:hypothetical protein
VECIIESQYKQYKQKQYSKLQQTYLIEASGQHHASALLLQGWSPWHTSNRRLGGGFGASFDALEKRKISYFYQISNHSTAYRGK